MKQLIFFLFSTLLLANELQLQESYTFDDHNIYAHDLFEGDYEDFYLFSVPEHQYQHKKAAFELIDLFAEHNISIGSNASKIITFRKEMLVSFEPLADELRQKFKAKIPTLNIKSINISPRGYINALPWEYSFEIKSFMLTRNKGSFSIYDSENKQRHFFTFVINATIKGFVSTTKIRRNDHFTSENIAIKTIAFTKISAPLLLQQNLQNSQANQYIAPNTLLTTKHITAIPLVQKGDVITGKIIDGSIHIELPVIAQQKGFKGDTIRVKKYDGTQLEAVINAKGSVVIQ
jgi:flagella basal body P-ring formation protein FlgA